jgi:branched-chain amino acid transport system substrate-binding protein
MVKPVKVAAAVALASVALAACGGGSSSTGGGGGGKTLIVSSDLPLQGASQAASVSTNNAIKLYLKQIGSKVGNYTIQFKEYDDSTAAKGAWDDATCAANAQAHVANASEVAVMGTYNSGCAKIEVPVLNGDQSGPMLMVSHANTNPGLTKTWDAGEPQKYYPTGKRNYARVITTDDYQGAGAALFAQQKLGVKKVYILNDNQTYGQGVAKAFETKAKALGITVIANEPWDAKQPNYLALFNKIKAASPDLVYLGGIFDNNGGQLVKDKVSVLGDNLTGVKLMGPDGFTNYPQLDKLAQGQGMYLSFAGLSIDQLVAAGGAAAKLLTDYKTEYKSEPAGSYALYGVAAMQVILAAIEKSDGTRKSVTDQIFTSGITIPADKSVLGKEIKIDPATGDTSAIDLSILVLKDNKETFVQAQAVS